VGVFIPRLATTASEISASLALAGTDNEDERAKVKVNWHGAAMNFWDHEWKVFVALVLPRTHGACAAAQILN
jgi:hypothetical protein